jgi:hypothetical protein
VDVAGVGDAGSDDCVHLGAELAQLVDDVLGGACAGAEHEPVGEQVAGVFLEEQPLLDQAGQSGDVVEFAEHHRHCFGQVGAGQHDGVAAAPSVLAVRVARHRRLRGW